MSNDPTVPDVFWRELATNDRRAHADEHERSLVLRNEELTAQNAELAAALAQARAAITVRHQLLADQTAALRERDRELDELRATLTAVLSSRRWQTGETVSRLARSPRALLGRVRRVPRALLARRS